MEGARGRSPVKAERAGAAAGGVGGVPAATRPKPRRPRSAPPPSKPFRVVNAATSPQPKASLLFHTRALDRRAAARNAPVKTRSTPQKKQALSLLLLLPPPLSPCLSLSVVLARASSLGAHHHTQRGTPIAIPFCTASPSRRLVGAPGRRAQGSSGGRRREEGATEGSCRSRGAREGGSCCVCPLVSFVRRRCWSGRRPTTQ